MCFNLRVTNASKLVVQENVRIKIDPIMMLDYVYSVLNDSSSYDTTSSSFFVFSGEQTLWYELN